MIRKIFFYTILLLVTICTWQATAFAQTGKTDTTKLPYPIQDRRGDAYTWQSRNPFSLSDTSLIKQTVEYDPVTKRYYIVEKIGGRYYRKPTYLTFEEYWAIKNKEAEADYFRKRANSLALLNRKVQRPKFKVFNNFFERIMGADSTGKVKIDIRPQGDVNILAGYQGQNIKNPTLPERARKNGGFDFDMNANVNVIANIGEKLKLPINYNTLANFDFENQLKLDYKGESDDIIKSIEAGNISFQNKGTLIQGVQSLFGLKTQLQYGKLFITAALANQRSQRQSLTLQGGAAAVAFTKKLDDYEENRNFLLGQYFRNNYNKTMASLPFVNSQVQILRMEVWVTNRNGATTDARDVVGFMDLGENAPFNPNINPLPVGLLPQNGSNDLYSKITSNPNYRSPSVVNSLLLSQGLTPVNDYEKTFARKLTPNEYVFNPQAGFIALNQQLQPDEVLGVAYEYTYNGQVFRVGEFAQDVGLQTAGVQKVLFLKLLKATSARVNLPIWDLMMKNVYNLDIGAIQPTDFKLNVLYEQPSEGLKRYLPEGDEAALGRPILRLLNLDRLNNRLDPQPDGVFDYVEGQTVISQQGKIIFPVLEPFGADLDAVAFNTPAGNAVQDKYLYPQLYDSIKAIAQTYANLNRFVFQGQAKGTGGSEIYLGAFNVPQGSVSVTAGGQILTENVDYTIDYNIGSVKILNSAILNSGVPVNIQFENSAAFGIQQRSFLGLRLDYIASKKLALGATMERLSERPFFTKTNYGEDPIRNTIYGLDFSYKSDLPGLTRLLNKLPFYSTKDMSSITAYGEGAFLKPGHPKQIGKGDEGLSYIDDFEGTRNSIDLRFPFIQWTLASTPQGNPAFPEASLTDSLPYNFNRAKLAWYNIEPILQDKNASNNPLRRNLAAISDPRVRQVYTNELFPQRTTNYNDVQTTTFDLSYYPTDPGPYNFETRNTELTAAGKLLKPNQRWAGIMRGIDQTDFETGNVEYVEIWVQDPFIKKPSSTGGKLLLNLGNVSEDILKDGKRFYENGLPTPQIPAAIDTSVWGKQPINPIQITQAFSNDPNDRPYQDVGFDGLTDTAEVRVRTPYLTQLQANFGATSPVVQRASKDPSNDNYVWYRDDRFGENDGILGRYKNFNNPQGNSPVATNSSEFSSAATLYPDNEDLNRDNTLNETEEYYEYQLDLRPGMTPATTTYLSEVKTVSVRTPDGTNTPEKWYLFRVPIKNYTRKVGSIPDFKSIRFMRMYMTDFEDSVTLRFAKLDLVRNQWRTFNFQVTNDGTYPPIAPSATTINVLAVNIEENSSKLPFNYKIPPGIERVQMLSNNNVNLLQNEQSMSIQVRNLRDGDSRAVFKTLNQDLRQYGRLSMFLHAEGTTVTPLKDSAIEAVIRIGQDFLSNYYEVRIPLVASKGSGSISPDSLWPAINNLDFDLQDLINLKLERNSTGVSPGDYFSKQVNGKQLAIYGNPNLGEVRGFLIGLQNFADDGPDIDAEVWVNELRLSKLDEHGGYAALARVDVKLADLGSLTVSANTYTAGFGTLEQRVNERARENLMQFDAALNIDAGKLVPKGARLSIPIYAGINKTIRKPEYDPYDLDIKLKDKIRLGGNKDSIRKAALDEITIKTLNFTNVRIQPRGKPQLWSLSNLDLTYSYTKFEQTSPLITKNEVVRHRASIGYTYSPTVTYIEPFKRLIRNKSPWLNFVRDINFNYKPSLLSFRADVNRQFGQFIPRIVSSDGKIDRVDTTYDKYFTFDRYYNLRWDLTRSLNIDFSAINNARVDEPFGLLNTKAKKDSVQKNFWKGGRNTLYTQRGTASYTLPLSKFPMLDWVTARYSYATSYNWIGASRLPETIRLGNTIENSQENIINGQFDFTRLYQKSRWLRNLENAPAPVRRTSTKEKTEPGTKGKGEAKKGGDASAASPAGLPTMDGGDVDNVAAAVAAEEPKLPEIPKRADVIKDKDGKPLKGKAKKEALRKWRLQKRERRKLLRDMKNAKPQNIGGIARAGGRLLTMIKNVSIDYNEAYRSQVNGYTDSTKYLGQNWNSMAPGLDYVFGRQPDTAWLNRKAAKGLITRDTLFNKLFTQRFEQRLSIVAQLEPFKEFNVTVNLDKTYSKDYSELYKYIQDSAGFRHLTPYATGGFNVSYIAFNTLFKKFSPNEASATFKTFETNRAIISQRLGDKNPYAAGATPDAEGYIRGYGKYAQDVLIPAFISAYTGKSPNSVGLIRQSNGDIKSNPFKAIKPMPNWRLTYTGLTRIPTLAKKFSAITVTHGYTGNLSMNSFTSALQYSDPFRYGAPAFIDTTAGKNDYVPFFLVPNITIQESFQPLLGIDVTTNDQMNIKAEYKKSRTLSLSLLDYQLSEVNSTEWTFGFSFRKKGFTLPFRLPFTSGKKLDNDISFRLDLAMRDDAQSNSRLDQANAYSTGGQKVLTIQPSIDYILNNRVNIKFYFDQQRVTPYISTSAPIINTRAGLQFRISLAP